MFKKKIALFMIPMLLIGTMAFAYTRDWDTTDPVDHSKNNTWPAEIREVMVDVGERLDDILNGFASGETVTDFDAVPMNNRASAPGAVADTVTCYSKDVSSKAEFFCQDEDGDEVQITSGGALNETAAQDVCTTTYPVGSIFISTVSTNPGTSLGCGTWATWGAGKVIVGLDTGDSDFDTSEETGGAKTHTLTTAEMPTHNHSLNGSTGTSGGTNEPFWTNTGQNDSNENVTNAGSGNAHNNLQPYIVAYLFERTA